MTGSTHRREQAVAQPVVAPAAPGLGDRTVVALAVAVTAAAWFRWSPSLVAPAPPLTALVVGLVVAVGLVTAVWLAAGAGTGVAAGTGVVAGSVTPGLPTALNRRRAVTVASLAVALAVLSGTLAERAHTRLVSATPGPVTGTATLVTDPESWFAGTRAVARFQGQRVRLQAHGAPARALAQALAGDRVELHGQRRGMSQQQIQANPWRRVVGTLDVDTVVALRPGRLHHQLANQIHRRLTGGARSLPEDQRALLSGLVLGDDRAQPPVLRHAFDAVGLSHLLAVSGQNVAFVLAAAGPLLRRFRLGTRWVVILVLLVFFATVTRFEPSVLRAVAMAALATIAAALGRPTPGLRILSWAVIGLVLADPLLVRSLGFQLSVAASAGILLLSPPLSGWVQRHLRLPSWVAAAMAVPLAAQLATAPLLVSRNGPLPLVSLPANMAAGAAAGALMTWGSSAGVLAGWLPGPLAWLVHLPSRVLLWWISQVALVGERWSTMGLSATQLSASIIVAGLAMTLRRYRRRAPPASTSSPGPPAGGVSGGWVARCTPRWWHPAVVAGAWAAVLALSGAPPARDLPQSVTLAQRSGVEVVVLAGPADPARLLRLLRTRVDGSIDLLVVTSGSRQAWEAATAVRQVIGVEVVLTTIQRPDASLALSGQTYEVGPLWVELRRDDSGDGLKVVITDLEAIPP